MGRASFVLVLLVAICLTFNPSFSLKKKKEAPAIARKEDIPYIKCSVCQHISTQLHLHLNKKRKEMAPKQLPEYDIIELMENICNLKKAEGDWILHLDIVEDGDALKLEVQAEEGECRTECKTIQRACEELLEDQVIDLAEILYKKEAEPKTIFSLLCNDLSKACAVKIPAVPKDREPGEPFLAKSSKDAEMERIMRSMSDMPGAPNMKMYSREDLMNGMPDSDDNDEDDEDMEDDEELHKGNVVGDKTGGNKLLHQAQSFINTVKKMAQQATSTTQKHVRKVTDWLGKWWSGKHDPRSKSSKSQSRSKSSKSQFSDSKTAEL